MSPKIIHNLSSTGCHQECLQACQQLIQDEPENPLPWKYAGKSLLALKQFEKAQQCLTKAHQLDSKDPETTKDIGNILLNLGRTEDAKEWYKKSLEINNNYAPAINNIANIKRQNGDNQEAANLFKRAIQADPQLLQAHTGAAASLLALGDLDQAQAIATQAIKINTKAPGINEILGIIFQQKKEWQKAVESYQNELAINPKSNASLLNLGLLLLKQEKAAAAIEPLSKAAAINPSEQCSLLLAQAYQNIGELKEAIIEYKKIDIIQSQNKIIPFNLGLCLLNTGNNIDAIEAFKIAIRLDESFLPAWGNIGSALMNEGRQHEALLATQKVLDLDPDNPDAHMNMGGIHKDLGNIDEALVWTLKSLELKPDNPTAHMNLGGIYKVLGRLDQALASTIKSLKLKPNSPDALINLGSIYKDLGKPDQALASTLKSLELEPDNTDANMNLSGIYQDLGNLDQALASALKSLELKPKASKAWYMLGRIKMAQGKTKEARDKLLNAIKINPKEYGAYFELSQMLKTVEEADKLVKSINSVKLAKITPQNRSLIEFALSNCYHKAENYDKASKHLQLANKNKLIVSPSNVKPLKQAIANSLSDYVPEKTRTMNLSIGKERIFIVGMPRSGSSLLETILSMNPKIKDLGESRSLEKAIAKAKQQKTCNGNNQNTNEYYSQLEPIDNYQHKYSTDKQLYNFIYINWIASQMPAAKIIHCHRNPMDNILSMHRSNLMAGNNYTSNLEDTAEILVAQEQVMQVQKRRHAEKIFSFDYDQFVNSPERNLRILLEWLDLEFNESYLYPEKSPRNVNTASVMQARKPISNKSVGGWKNYEIMLKPALKIIKESGIKIDHINN